MPAEVFLIGRDPSCHLRPDDELVSALHCRVTRLPTGAVFVEDIGSTNGTWLERGTTRSQVRMPERIYPGDVLIVGRTRIPWTREGNP